MRQKTKDVLFWMFLTGLVCSSLLVVHALDLMNVRPTVSNSPLEFATLADGEGWLTGYGYRKQINITGAVGAGTNYQVPFNLTLADMEGHNEEGFNDVAFTDNDGYTPLSFWRESYSLLEGKALFWINVTDSLESEATIYMYYGKAGGTTGSNGTATFPLFEDWASETIGSQWTIGTNDGAYSFNAAGATHGSIIKVEGSAGTVKEEIYSNDSYTHNYSLRMRSNLESTAAASQITQLGFGDYGASAAALLKNYQGADQFYVRDDGAVTDIQTIDADNFDAWGIFDIYRDGTNAYLYRDGGIQATGSCEPDELGMNVDIYCRDSEYDLYNDWLFVHKWISGVAIDTIGDEETAPPPPPEVWHNADSGELWFTLLSNSLGGWLVLVGMIMVPASTLYLVKGRKDNLSFDKLFIFLVAFIFGWALIIGGIGP